MANSDVDLRVPNSILKNCMEYDTDGERLKLPLMDVKKTLENIREYDYLAKANVYVRCDCCTITQTQPVLHDKKERIMFDTVQ